MKFPVIITTKSDRIIHVRPPRMSDALSALEFINTLSREQTFITMQGEQQTITDEEKYLSGMIKKTEEHNGVQLFALDGDKVVANTSIELGIRVSRHVGTLAIAISDGYRNEGLGSTIIDLLIEYAKETLPLLRIVELKVFANNPKAKHVYEKLGFKEYGHLPNGVLYRGSYIDEIFMYKLV